MIKEQESKGRAEPSRAIQRRSVGNAQRDKQNEGENVRRRKAACGNAIHEIARDDGRAENDIKA